MSSLSEPYLRRTLCGTSGARSRTSLLRLENGGGKILANEYYGGDGARFAQSKTSEALSRGFLSRSAEWAEQVSGWISNDEELEMKLTRARCFVWGMLGLLAGLALLPTQGFTGGGGDEAVERTRKQTRMLDDLYKTAIVPVVMTKCVACHPHYAKVPKSQAIGALVYTLPVE